MRCLAPLKPRNSRDSRLRRWSEVTIMATDSWDW